MHVYTINCGNLNNKYIPSKTLALTSFEQVHQNYLYQ